jgi:sugar-specific transcriptional regulator TrmB
MMDFEQQLATMGLDGKLYQAYIAALELGEAPVQMVAKKAGFGRTTAYHLLAKLEQDGLIRMVERGGKRHVLAEDPVVILQRLERQRQVIGDLLPQLRSIYNRSKSKPEIRFYEGEEGILTVLWDTLTCRSKKLLGILSMHELIETPGLAKFDEYLAERVKRGIALRVLRSESNDVENIWPESTAELRELRHSPPAVLLSMTTYIYDDKVAFISSKKENYGMIFQSEEFSRLHESLFEGIWAISTPPKRHSASTGQPRQVDR